MAAAGDFEDTEAFLGGGAELERGASGEAAPPTTSGSGVVVRAAKAVAGLAVLALAVGAVLVLQRSPLDGGRGRPAPASTALSPGELENFAAAAAGVNDLGEQLQVAAAQGLLPQVKDLISRGADIEFKEATHYEDTPLHRAAKGGHVAVVQALVAARAALEVKDTGGLTPLNMAAWSGHGEVAAALVSAGADMEATDQADFSPLNTACWYSRPDVAEVLVKAGADLEHLDKYKMGPLLEASFRGEMRVVEALVNAGADVNTKDLHGCTPLCQAGPDQCGNYDGCGPVADFLRSHGAHV